MLYMLCILDFKHMGYISYQQSDTKINSIAMVGGTVRQSLQMLVYFGHLAASSDIQLFEKNKL